ncbi:hypothetical protein [Nocardia harenae]|uniref:hypothetical protein n=1 Tax=Nocardia harenae TaxID=358707 RepID=UPI0008376D2E|nr:hypothetical protein [Nocardia harenae]
MVDLIPHAVPAFVRCFVLEAASFRFRPDEAAFGYEFPDAGTGIGMGPGGSGIQPRAASTAARAFTRPWPYQGLWPVAS